MYINCMYVVQESMNMYRHVYTLYIYCTNMYIQTKFHYCTCSGTYLFISCSHHVYTTYIHGAYMVCTNSCVYVQRIQKQKNCLEWSSNTGPHAYHQYALTTMLAVSLWLSPYLQYIYILLYLEVGDVRPAQDQPLPPPPPWRRSAEPQHGSLQSRGRRRSRPWRRWCGGTLQPDGGRASDLKGGWLLCNWHRQSASHPRL